MTLNTYFIRVFTIFTLQKENGLINVFTHFFMLTDTLLIRFYKYLFFDFLVPVTLSKRFGTF